MVGSIGLIGVPIVILVPGLRLRRQVARWACRMMITACFLPLEVIGRDHLPTTGNYVVVCNHFSFCDGLILTAALPPKLGFVVKAELANNPFTGWLFHRLGGHFVQRFDKRKAATAARVALKRARRGDALLFFAEGTFRPEPGLLPFHLGAFSTAVGADIPVVPIGLRGNRTLMQGHSWLLRWTRLAVDIAPPVYPDKEPGRQAARLRDAVRPMVLDRCGEPDVSELEKRSTTA